MATSGPTNLPAFFSTDADFRTWGSGVNAALAAIGLVNNNDTGSINWTTVTKPSAINTSQGFEIWKLNDALQATVPFFFKIEYGSGGVVDRPGIWLTIGSATNGSGTLSGQTSSRAPLPSSSSKSAGVQLPSYFSGDGSRFSFMLNLDSSSNAYSIFLACERTRDSSGAYTADGLVYMINASVASFAVIPASGTLAIGTQPVMPIIPVYGISTNLGSIHAVGTDLALGTMVYFLGKPFYGLSAVNVDRGDAGTLAATFTATVLGATHTFISFWSQATAAAYIANAGNNNANLGMLWE